MPKLRIYCTTKLCDGAEMAIFMAALRSRYGHYIFALWFLLYLSSSFLVSSPNLSRRRLDVYHPSTHGVALVRSWDAGLKRAAYGSLKIQDVKIAKSLYLGTIAQLRRAISSQLQRVAKSVSS